MYGVFVVSYATAEIKERLERGEEHIIRPDQITSQAFYFERDERQAGIKFYQAAKQAMVLPLAYGLTVMRDSDVVVRVKT